MATHEDHDFETALARTREITGRDRERANRAEERAARARQRADRERRRSTAEHGSQVEGERPKVSMHGGDGKGQTKGSKVAMYGLENAKNVTGNVEGDMTVNSYTANVSAGDGGNPGAPHEEEEIIDADYWETDEPSDPEANIQHFHGPVTSVVGHVGGRIIDR